MLVLIDNFDSFTYNIVQAYQQLGEEVYVVRNHAISLAQLEQLQPSLIVLGPGPGNPSKSGVCKHVLKLAEKGVAVFGICLGHQVIAENYGALVVRAKRVQHGKTSLIHHARQGVFASLPESFLVTRYHSLIVDPLSLPEELQVTAWTSEGEVMGIRHTSLPIEGVQFHPESIASEQGLNLLYNTRQSSQIVKSLPR